MSTADHVIQLTDADWLRHGKKLAADHPDATWLIVDSERLTMDHELVDWGAARPTVAWFGFDGLQSSARRRHFQLARTAPSLQFALTSYAGLDDEFWKELHSNGTLVTNAHLSGPPISQFILARVLEHYHQPARLAAARGAKQWSHQPYREIDESTWIVVGLGAIGTGVARKASGCGAHVIGVRRAVTGDEAQVDEAITLDQLPDRLPEADVVVFAVPDSPATTDLVDAAFLAAMRRDAALVNVGRGSLIVEDDLLAALDADEIGVAILDVAREEPLPDTHRFWDHPKVMFSPHTSAGGLNRHGRSAQLFSDNLSRIFNDETPENPYFSPA